MKTDQVTISRKQLECLREHLNEAYRILESLGMTGGANPPEKARIRVPFQKGVENYKRLLESGEKRKYPAHLINKKGRP
jgi:hypothetical protein